MTQDIRDVLKLALEYIQAVPDDRYNAEHIDRDALITTIKEALAHCPDCGQLLGDAGHIHTCSPQRTEQEPVCPDCKAKVLYECVACSSNNYPPQRSESSGKPSAWVGLTRMDLIKCGVLPFGMSYELCQAIEAKLREKNSQHKEKNT